MWFLLSDDPIVTDRPDFTESAIVVPYRRFQVESGLTYLRPRLTGPELLFRYGATDRLEMRVGRPDWEAGDTYVGIKYQLGPARNGDDWAIIPAVTGSDPEVKLCWSRDLGGKWSLSTMAYGLWTKGQFSFQPTASFGHELGPRWAMFIEYAGGFSKDETDHIAHAGLAYRLSKDQQIDTHAGLSLRDRVPFLAAGYSVRF